ncbi:hypothetical protein BDR22DRAFT_887082 [Usnea florida]
MQFSIFAVIATLATIVATSPTVTVNARPDGMLRSRAINNSTTHYTEAELADQNPETCCCCPPNEITNVDHLHKLIAASE